MLYRRCLLVLVFYMTPFLAIANNLEDIQQLLNAKRFQTVLERADQLLSRYPKDPQIRFVRGLALVGLNRHDDAIKAFSDLIKEDPKRPELHNNLAVLYAQKNQLDKARLTLLTAIQTHPSYAIAHKNLEGLYAHLAAQSYDKALELESSPASHTQLTLIRELSAGQYALTMPSSSQLPPRTTITHSIPPPLSLSATSPATSVIPTPSMPTSTPQNHVNQAPPTPARSLASVPPGLIAPASTPHATHSTQPAGVLEALHNWSTAWSNKNITAYLASYDRRFRTPGKQKFEAWAAERTQRIASQKAISVKLSDIKITPIDETTVKVRLRQAYKADHFSATTSKRLILKKTGSRWLIIEERT